MSEASYDILQCTQRRHLHQVEMVTSTSTPASKLMLVYVYVSEGKMFFFFS